MSHHAAKSMSGGGGRTDDDVLFQCLFCDKKGFKGTIDKESGSLNANGLSHHLQKKRDKQGKLACLEYYENNYYLEDLPDFDFQPSLMAEYRHLLEEPEPSTNKRTRPAAEEGEEVHSVVSSLDASNHLESDSEPEDQPEDLGQFVDVVLPKSNSLKGNSFFKKEHTTFKALTMPTSEALDSFTFPSKKLFPYISYDTIIDYAKRKGLLNKMQTGTAHINSQIEKNAPEVPEDNDLEDLEDWVDVISLPSFTEVDQPVYGLDFDTDEDQQDEEELSVQVVNEENNTHTLDPGMLPNPCLHLRDRLRQESLDQHDPNSEIPTKHLVQLQLLQLQEKHRLSFAAYEDILAWAKMSASLEPGIFRQKFPNREDMITTYRQYLGLKDGSYKFRETIVQWLPDNKPLVIQRRPFLDCIFELLTKESLLGPDSCNISLPHPTDPFALEPDDIPEMVSELHHGTWWRKTMKKLCKEKGDILCPIAFEVDETYLDTHGRLSVTPFNVKVLLFNSSTNRREDASTTWFYLPNDEAEAAHHENRTEAHHKIQNLHNALRECFKDLKALMDQNVGVSWELTYAGEKYDVKLHFSVAFVISDTAMHDKLCCHYGVRNEKVKSICRHCNCPTKYLSSSSKFKKTENWLPRHTDPTIHGYDNKEYWKSISHYPVKNALDELNHGSNVAKIHLNTCGEVLHMHQKGAMVRVIESLVYVWHNGKRLSLGNISLSSKQVNIKSSLENLNHVGHQYGAFLHRQSDRDKPRTKFKNSLFKTTKKNAHEQAGVLMCVLLSLLSDRGRQICLEERTMDKTWIEDYVYALELILMVEVWLKKDSYPRDHVADPARLGKAIGLYMDRLTEICPRGGMGSLLIKNHLMFHLPQYIQRWGPPRLFDSSIMESAHKTQAKRPGQLTQQRPESFISQLSKRYCDLRIVKRFRETFRVDRLFNGKLGEEEKDPEEEVDGNFPKTTGSHFELGIDSTGKPGVKWKRMPGRQTHLQAVQDIVAEVVISNMAHNIGKRVVDGFTEYKMMADGEPATFRAHPSYRSASRQQRDVWYDWALFNLQGREIPGQILMFIHVPYLQDTTRYKGIDLIQNEPHAVVRLFQSPPKERFRVCARGTTDLYSHLVRFGQTREHFNIVPCKFIHSTTIVVPNIPMKVPTTPISCRKKKKRRKELDDLIGPLGPGYFVVYPRFIFGECFGKLIESY